MRRNCVLVHILGRPAASLSDTSFVSRVWRAAGLRETGSMEKTARQARASPHAPRSLFTKGRVRVIVRPSPEHADEDTVAR